MKILKSFRMRVLLAMAVKEAKKLPKIKSPEYFLPLASTDLRNGWHYQANKEYGRVAVYAFKPPKNQYAKPVDYILTQKLG